MREQLTRAADEDTRAKLVRMIPGAIALGVPVPKLRELAASLATQNAGLSLEELCDLMDSLCHGRCREEILLGTFVMGRRKKLLPAIPWKRIDRWVNALDNWETCDQLASNVIGFVVAAHLEHVDQLFEWTKSETLWRRRCALATASTLNQKGRLYPQESLRVCLPLLNDPEPMVQKAVAWVIREVSKKDEVAAFEFLSKHRSKAHHRVLREASEKLTDKHRVTLAR
jgi:3-methyladenine DNA glycosylase AlkD